MAGEMARLRALVRGRVQGVNFRFFVASHARRLGLKGYVRNLPDGATVEVDATGPREALEALVPLLHRGPAFARVDRVDLEWLPYEDLYRDFRTL